MYARKRKGFEDSSSCFNSVEQAATYLTKTTAQGISADGTLKSLLESRKSIKKVIGEFDEVIKYERLDPWSQLTLLVDIAGETVAEAFVMNEERRLTSEEIGKMCRIAADELYCRMPELGTWEDFCEHIEDTYYSVFPSQQNSASAKEIADVVHRLMKTKAICT